MLSEDGLLYIKPNPIGGLQRVYRFGNYGLSLINSPMAHKYSFAWEAAVIKFTGQGNEDWSITYITELSSDVEVFRSELETNQFISKARDVLLKLTALEASKSGDGD